MKELDNANNQWCLTQYILYRHIYLQYIHNIYTYTYIQTYTYMYAYTYTYTQAYTYTYTVQYICNIHIYSTVYTEHKPEFPPIVPLHQWIILIELDKLIQACREKVAVYTSTWRLWCVSVSKPLQCLQGLLQLRQLSIKVLLPLMTAVPEVNNWRSSSDVILWQRRGHKGERDSREISHKKVLQRAVKL